MTNFEKITEFDLTVNRDTVFQLIDLYPGNSVYEDILEEYSDIEQEALQAIHPQAFLKFTTISETIAEHIGGEIVNGTPVIYVLMTIGDEIADLSSKYFNKGDYLLGMLVNAISDAYLFRMEDFLKDRIMERSIAREQGISKRLEAPLNMPMLAQKDILDEIKAEEELEMGVTEGYMFTTVKTLSYMLLLSDDKELVYVGHNCDICTSKNCKMRRAKAIS